MLKPAPIATDEASLADSAARLERHVAAAARNLDQYSPALALAKDGRLMEVLAEGDHQTFARYPVLTAPMLIDAEPFTAAKIARANATARRLQINLAPYQPQHLPGPDATMVVGLAMPLGFAAYKGLDVNWNGGGWSIAEGFIRASLHHQQNRDIHIAASEQPAEVKVIWLSYSVVYTFATEPNDLGTYDEVIRITGAQIKAGNSATFSPAVGIASNDSKTWTSGELAAPIAYCIAPTDTQGPVTLRIGQGEIPYSRSFMRPFSIGGVTAP